MQGLNVSTGKAIDGAEHVLQSVRDIVTTPRGSRVMLREYGCAVPDMVDRPINELFQLDLNASVARALKRWEPRFRLTAVSVTGRTPAGRVIIEIRGTIIATGTTARIEGLIL